MSGDGPPIRLRFLSTFEPATSFYRDLLPFLAAAGAQVEVVLSSAEYRGGRPPLAEALQGTGVRVTTVPAGLSDPVSPTDKLRVMVSYLMGTVARTLVGRGADVNVFFSTPPLFAIWGITLRAIRRQRYVCIVQDVYPDVLVQDGALAEHSLIARAMRWLSRLIWRRADAVVVIGRCMRDLVAEGGVAIRSVVQINNWGHDAIGEPVALADNELRAELGLGDHFVVLYSGNLGVSHSFDEIVEVIRRFEREDPKVRFVFIGTGSRHAEIAQARKRHGLRNIVLLPFQPAERLAHSLSLGDIHFISLRPGFEGVVVPSKAYGAMAAGRPIVYLGSPEGEIARSIAEHDIGIVVAPGDVDGLEKAIRSYRDDPDLVQRQGHRAAVVSRDELGAARAMRAWSDLLLGDLPDG